MIHNGFSVFSDFSLILFDGIFWKSSALETVFLKIPILTSFSSIIKVLCCAPGGIRTPGNFLKVDLAVDGQYLRRRPLYPTELRVQGLVLQGFYGILPYRRVSPM